MGRNILLLIGSLLLCGFICEWVLSVNDWIILNKYLNRMAPFYPYGSYTRDGEPLTAHQGYLRLVPDPHLVYRNLPGYATPYFRINANGYRGADIEGKTPGKRRVIVLGGSAAFGTGLPADNQTLAAHLERRLPEAEVINAAVIGYTSGQELTALVLHLLDLQPDLVIVFDGWNDFSEGRVNADVNRRVHAHDEIEHELRQSYLMKHGFFPVRFMENFSYTFFPVVRSKISTVIERRGAKKPEPAAERKNLERAAQVYAENTRKASAILHAHGADLVCAFQPDTRSMARSGDPDGVSYDYFRARASAELQEKGVNCMDFNERPGELMKPGVFLDEIHLTGDGCAIAAQLLEEPIRRSLQGERSSALKR